MRSRHQRGLRSTRKGPPAASGRRDSNGFLYLAIVIFALAFLVRLLPIEEYHGWDESIYLQHAERIAFGKSNYDELAFRPPLLPLVLAGGFRIWHSPYVASVIVALLSSSIALALFFIGRRLHSPEAGLFSALLVATHPLYVRFGHLLLTDAIVASMLAFALVFALRDEWWAALLCGVFLGLAGLTKFTGLGALVPLLLFIAYRAWRGAAHKTMVKRTLRNLLLAGAGFTIIFAPYLWWAQQRFGSFIVLFERAQAIVNLEHGGPLYYLSIALFTVPLLVGLILAAVALLSKRSRDPQHTGRRTGIAALAVLALAWALVILGYLNTFPNREHRYALAAIVPLLVLAGIGYAAALQRVRSASKGARAVSDIALIGAVILILALSFNSFSRLTEPHVNHYQQPPVEMALRIAALNDTSRPIYATSDYPIYGYYTNNRVVVVDGPRFLEAYPRIMPRDGYLVLYKNRSREPTVTWAEQQQELTRILEGEDIVVYEYDNPRHDSGSDALRT